MSLTYERESERRLEVLYRYQILDSFPEMAFERLASLAQNVFDVPIVLISLADRERHYYKSHRGLNGSQTPYADPFCSLITLTDDALVIPDTTREPRYRGNPLINRHPFVRFFAGAPLRTLDGYSVGALSIMDTAPRSYFGERQTEMLRDLAALAVDEMELRLAGLRLFRS